MDGADLHSQGGSESPTQGGWWPHRPLGAWPGAGAPGTGRAVTPNLRSPQSFSRPDPQGRRQSLAWPHPWSSLSLGFLIPTGWVITTLQAAGGGVHSTANILFLLSWKVRSGLLHTAGTP